MREVSAFLICVCLGVFLFGCGGDAEDGEVVVEAGFDHEYTERPEYERFPELYGFQFENPELLDPALVYRALNRGQIDVADVFTTDGRIEAYNLRILEDDKNLFPPYDACPIVREDALETHPGLKEVLNLLKERISPDEMRAMNLEFSEESIAPEKVAREFLEEKGLLEDGLVDIDPADDAESLEVGSKHFGEQKILGEMLAILIENHTPYEVDKSLGLQGTKVCFRALREGEIDMYVEYTGTGLANILNEEYDPEQTPAEILDYVRDEFDEQYDIGWLEPLGFENTYAYAMKDERAEELGVEKISDLKPYVRE